MQSSESSVSPKKGKFLTHFSVSLIRIILGLVLMFSGFVKAVDPWGGLYKISDYLNAWSVSASHEQVLLLACLLSGFEFVLGTLILIGCYRKATRWLVLAFMSFMTLLTLYIWIFNPVEDCGCFGDALKISNTLTFWKNVVLLIISILYFRCNLKTASLIKPRLQWLGLLFTCFYVLAIQIYGYHVQPLLDFRPFPVGTNLEEISNAENELLFKYERNGVEKNFAADELPDSTWTFIERVEPEDEKSSSSISVFDGSEEVTDEIFGEVPVEFILLISNPQRYGMSRSEMANRLFDLCTENGYDMFAITPMNENAKEKWKEKTGAQYEVYTAEDTDIKMLARGDAALMALKNGSIVWKKNVFALNPDFPKDINEVNESLEMRDDNALVRFTLIWIISMLVVYLLSRYTSEKLFTEKKKVKKDDKKEEKYEE